MTSNIGSTLQHSIPAHQSPSHSSSKTKFLAKKALSAAASFWFVVAVIGQMIFAYYIIAQYGSGGVSEKIEALHNTGEQPVGIMWVVVHLILAFIVTMSGPLQLIPQVRSRAPRFHRFNGRVYVVTAITIALIGLIATVIRGPAAGIYTAIGFGTNAVLIIMCAVLAIRFAISGDISTHRRWALRLFLMVSGTWFYRIMLMFWFTANQGPVGHTEAFDGPFDIALAFGFFALPLAVLQLYFWAQKAQQALSVSLVALSLVILTLMMGAGIAVTTVAMWLPMA